jgi:prepilin-type processing-associated H-X9-DG protein
VVVIAIIGILTALLLPVLSKAKASARSTSCNSHLRQMGMALQMYVHDNQNKYPHYLGSPGPSYGDATSPGPRGLVYWSSKLFPYCSLSWSNTANHCAGYKGRISGPYERGAIDRLGSYAYNAAGIRTDDRTNEYFGLGPVIFWKVTPTSYVPPVSEAQVSVPSEMLAMGDSLVKETMYGGSDHWRCGGPFSSDLAAMPYVLRHGKNYNQLYCDGHVSSMSPSILFDPSKTAPLWNYDHQPHPELWKP